MQIPGHKHCRANLAREPNSTYCWAVVQAAISAQGFAMPSWRIAKCSEHGRECTRSDLGWGNDNTSGGHRHSGDLPSPCNPACGNAMRRLLDANNAVSTSRSGSRAPNGLPPVVKSRICVAYHRCSSVKYVEYSPSSRLGLLATPQFPSVRQTVRCSSPSRPAKIPHGSHHDD